MLGGESSVVAAAGERNQGTSQVLDGIEGVDPRGVLLERPDEETLPLRNTSHNGLIPWLIRRSGSRGWIVAGRELDLFSRNAAALPEFIP